MATVEEIFAKVREELEEIVQAFKDEIAKLRVGAVDVETVKNISVDVYDSSMPVYQLATVLAPNAMTVVVTPWDKNIIKDLADALSEALGDVNPVVKGESIYLNFPPITEEKKKEYLKLIGKIAEKYRQQLRDIRNEAKRKLEHLHKEGGLPDNDFYKALERLDELTRNYRQQIDDAYAKKEAQLNSV